jgi:hypothetical protein
MIFDFINLKHTHTQRAKNVSYLFFCFFSVIDTTRASCASRDIYIMFIMYNIYNQSHTSVMMIICDQ